MSDVIDLNKNEKDKKEISELAEAVRLSANGEVEIQSLILPVDELVPLAESLFEKFFSPKEKRSSSFVG